jgi:glutathione S-transferase
MKVQVHILGPQFSTFTRSVMLCCEEKEIRYSHGFNFDNQEVERNGETHLSLHPFGKMPVLIHGDRKIFETATICRYLDSEFDGSVLQPKDNYACAIADQWSAAISQYIDQTIVREYLLEFAFPKGKNGQIRSDQIAKVQPHVLAMLNILEKQIGSASFICSGQYTIADALLTPILDYLVKLPTAPKLFESYPILMDYAIRMQQRQSGRNVLK